MKLSGCCVLLLMLIELGMSCPLVAITTTVLGPFNIGIMCSASFLVMAGFFALQLSFYFVIVSRVLMRLITDLHSPLYSEASTVIWWASCNSLFSSSMLANLFFILSVLDVSISSTALFWRCNTLLGPSVNSRAVMIRSLDKLEIRASPLFIWQMVILSVFKAEFFWGLRHSAVVASLSVDDDTVPGIGIDGCTFAPSGAVSESCYGWLGGSLSSELSCPGLTGTWIFFYSITLLHLAAFPLDILMMTCCW